MFHPDQEYISIVVDMEVYGTPQGNKASTTNSWLLLLVQIHIWGLLGIGGCRQCQAAVRDLAGFFRKNPGL
jgi:hypothetical protein